MLKTLSFFIVLCFTSLAQADSYYCSTQGGNGYINTGDTLAKVQATCGAPTSSAQQQTPSTVQQQTQVWMYTPNVVAINAGSNITLSNAVKATTTVKPAVSFRVVNNQVTAIASSIQGNLTQFRCPQTGQTIKVGATANQLQTACGQPTNLTSNTQMVNVQPHLITTWSYQVNSYSQPLVLQFQDGYLVKIKP